MTKPKTPFSLSARDKTPAPSGWGMNFHHTDPQRRVPCVKGDMLAPASADDIAPISPEAMRSVQQAIELLANLVGDHDHNLYLGNATAGELTLKARDIMLVAKGITGILRVTSPAVASAPAATVETVKGLS